MSNAEKNDVLSLTDKNKKGRINKSGQQLTHVTVFVGFYDIKGITN